MGYSTTKAGNDYRSLELDEDGNVISLNDKTTDSEDFSYIGICGIKDYKDFWKYMKEKKSLTMGESYGILRLLKQYNFNSFKFTWYDTGNKKSLINAKEKLKSEHQPNILEKEDEAIWFANNKTIKFSTDTSFIKDRVARTNSLDFYVPKVIDSSDNFYTYDFIEGEVFSKKVTGKKFEYLLSWLDDFWKPVDLNDEDRDEFITKCRDLCWIGWIGIGFQMVNLLDFMVIYILRIF